MQHVGPVCCLERRPQLLGDQSHLFAAQLFAPQPISKAPTRHQSHHEVRTVWLPPEVVEGHDVRVLETRNELRLSLEAANERWIVREVRADDSYGHRPTSGRLIAAANHSHRPSAKFVAQFVAPYGEVGFRTGCSDRGGVGRKHFVFTAEHSLFDSSDLARRFDAELISELEAQRLIAAQSFCLSAGTLQSDHELPGETFSQRVLSNEGV